MVIIVFLFPTYVYAQISSHIRDENSLKTWNLLEADERAQSCSEVTR
jgi:hypothetical protein